VQADSPADRAGLRVGDTVMEVNGKIPKNIIEFGNLLTAQPGRELTLTIRRGTQLEEMKVKLVSDSVVFNADLVRRKLGLEVRPVSRGFRISDVERDSPAAEAGLQKNMLIVSVNGQLPDSVKALAKMLNDKRPGETVPMNVLIPQRSGFWLRGAAEIPVR
jgi:serine protease DegQ